MKRLTNYLFFLDLTFKLDKIIPIKNISGIYLEEEFVEQLFKDLLRFNPIIKSSLRKGLEKNFQTFDLGNSLGDLTMEVHPLEFTIDSDSAWLITFFEGKGEKKTAFFDSLMNSKSAIDYVDEFSHEIKNSVNIIHGISDLMNSSGNEEVIDLIPTLSSSVKHLKGLVTNYLLNRKHENMRWEQAEFDLETELGSIVKQFEYLNKSESKKILLQLEPNVPAKLIGFSSALRQILINLVANAIEHTSNGEVVLKVLFVRKEFDEIVLKFVVSDSGEGIQEEALNRIFKRLQYSSVEKNGFGLGLNICKGILNSLQSDLLVSSEVGMGSSFYFELSFHQPVVDSSFVEKTSGTKNIGLQSYDKRVLIVDDDHLNRLVATKHLNKFGLHCESASNGVIAIQKLYDSHFDLVILDIHLPLVDGYTLFSLVQHRFPHLKVVFSTGSAKSSLLGALKEGQNQSFLKKPYSQEDLSKVLAMEFGG